MKKINNLILLHFTLLLWLSHHGVNGQSVNTTSSYACANGGSSAVFYIIGGAECFSPTVTNTSSWTVSPSNGVNISYVQTSPGVYNQIQVTFTLAGSYSIGASYSCTGGGSGGSATPAILNVYPPVAPSLMISADKASICGDGNEVVTFTAHPTNGGSSPTYSWHIGGNTVVNERGGSFTASSDLLNNNDVVTATLYSSKECASPLSANSTNSISMSVTEPAPVSVTVNSSYSSLCTGGGIGFTASIENGGISPVIEWRINGNPAPPSDVPQMGPLYLIYNAWNFPDNSTVQCFVTSSDNCTAPKPAESNVITVPLTSEEIFTVGITVEPNRYPPVYCQDEVTFVATTSHPATIYWYKNDEVVATGETYDPVSFSATDQLIVKAYPISTNCLQNDFDEEDLSEFFSIEEPVGPVNINLFGDAERCQGIGQSNFYAVADNAKNFSWSISSGAGTISPYGTNNYSATVEWNAGFSGEAIISVTATGCSGDAQSAQFSYLVHPHAFPPVEVALSYCDWERAVLKFVSPYYGNYNWFKSDGTFLGSGISWQLDEFLAPGTYSYQVESVSEFGCASTARANVSLTITSGCDDKLNWIETIGMDENQTIYSHTKNFFDLSGKPIQSQSKQFTHQGTGNIFVTQNLHDRYDRVVGSTLPAPLAQTDFKYNHFFVVNESSQPYDYDNFDDPLNNTVLSPDPVKKETPGTLGWYYSGNNNLEDHVPVTGYPYSRTEFYEDGTGEVKRSASPGDVHRLGMGHEILSGTFPVYGELNDYLAKRRLSGLPDQQDNNTFMREGIQSVVRDENGKYAVSITDKSGKTVMAARKGTAADNVLQVTNSLSSNLDESSDNYRPLTYFYILHDQNIAIAPGANTTYTVEDIVSGSEFIPPQSGIWPAGFYRIVLTSGSISFSYTNYYLDVSYQFYDDAGRLKYSISPNGYQQWKSGSPFAAIDKTSYKYNHRGWLLEMIEPDAGKTEYVYRRDGKIRFSQNAKQQDENHFSYTHYDQLGRPIESGEYIGSNVLFKDATMMGMLEQVNPQIWEGDVRDWVKTHYDVPDPNEAVEIDQTFVRGAVSWTENKYSKTWYAYDELGRVRTMRQRIPMANIEVMNHYAYDFLGNVILMIHYPDQGNGYLYQYYYDQDKRLKEVRFSDIMTEGNGKILARYEYYLHGPLKRVELGDKLQGIDFVYNINGWLTQINHPETNNDPGGDGNTGDHADFRKDAFGMLLDYYESQMGVFEGAYNAPRNDPNHFHKLPDIQDENNNDHYLNAFVPSPSLKFTPPHILQGLEQIKEAIKKQKNEPKRTVGKLLDEPDENAICKDEMFGSEARSPRQLAGDSAETRNEPKRMIGKVSGRSIKEEESHSTLPFNERIDPNTLIASAGNRIYSTPAVVFDGNGIQNHEFDQGTANWNLYDWTGATASTWSVVQNANLSGTNAAHIDIKNTDNSGWKIQLQQTLGFMLEQGKTYEISFIARAESPRRIRAAFSGSPSNTEYWNSGDVNLTTNAQIFGPFNYTCNNANVANETSFNFKFYLAYGTTSDVWIDKVIIVDKTGGSGAVAAVNVTPLNGTIAVGQSMLLTKTILPTNATNQNVTWSSGNTAVATVNSNGVVTAVATGTATITATTTDGGYTGSSSITVLPPGSNSARNPEFDEGKNYWTFYDWSGPNNSNGGNIFSIVQNGGLSGNNAAYVDIVNTNSTNWTIALRNDFDFKIEQGHTYEISFKAKAESPRPIDVGLRGNTSGATYWSQTVNLTATPQTFGPYFYTCNDANVANEATFRMMFYLAKGVLSDVWLDNLSVRDITTSPGAVAAVTVSPTSVILAAGQSKRLTRTIIPADATNQNVTWSSSNPSVAMVNSSGLVTGVTAGTANITVTTEDGGFTASSAFTVLPGGSNTLKNHEFDSNKDYWRLLDWTGPNNSNGGNSFSVVQGAGLSGANSAYIDIVNDNNSGWTLQLQQDLDFELEQGHTYEISFTSKAESNRSLEVALRGASGNYWNANVNLTTASQTFGPFLYTCNDPGVLTEPGLFGIVFYLSKGIISDVWIDNVIVKDVTGTPGAVIGVNISPLAVTLAAGQSKKLTHTVSPPDANNLNVTWSSSNPSVATVNSSGLVTGIAAGTANITVTTEDGGFTASSAFTVLPAGSNTLKNHEFDNDKNHWVLNDYTGPNNSNGGNTFSIVQGEGLSGNNAAYIDIVNDNNNGWTLQFLQALDFELEQGHTYEISFTSKGESNRPLEVALRGSSNNYWNANVNLTTVSQSFGPFYYTCDNAGVLTDPGFAVIFYLSEGVISDVWIDNVMVKDVTSTPGAVLGVNISPSAVTFAAGQSKKLTHAVFPPDATNQNVTWSSSNPSVATVSNAGLVTGAALGSATITVTTEDGGHTASSSFTVLSAGSNTLKNHEFDNNKNYWALYDYTGPNNSSGGNTFSVVQGAGLSGNNAAHVDIVNDNNSGWTLQLQQDLDFELEQGHTYEISFTSKAESNRPLEVALRGSAFNYWEENVTLTTASQTFGPFLYTCNDARVLTEPDLFGIVFYLAQGVVSDVWIDNVIVKDVTGIGAVLGVNISPLEATLAVGQHKQLKHVVLPPDAINKSVTWSSSNPSVATVNSAGLVEAVAAGAATITVTTEENGISASSSFTVLPVGSNTIDNREFDDGPNRWTFYDWSGPNNGSGGNSFSIVQNAGLSGGNAGYVDIVNDNDVRWTINLRQELGFALEQGRTYEISFMAKAESARQMELSLRGDESDTFYWEGAVNLTSTLQTFGPFLYTCNNPNVSADTTFFLTFYMAKGVVSDVWIDKVSVIDKTGVPGAVVGVNVTPTEVTLTPGQVKQLTKAVAPSNATNQNVSWSSSNTSIATVSNSGLVTAAGPGTATITVRTEEGYFTASSSVTVIQPGSNTLSNVEFDNGKNQWTFYDWTGTNWTEAGNTFSIVQGAGLSGDYSAYVNVVTTNTTNSRLQLRQTLGFELQQGHTYEISFMAKAESSRQIQATIRGDILGATYWSTYADLTTTAQTFGPYQFTCNAPNVSSESVFLLQFYMANGPVSDVWLDNVIVRDVTTIPVTGISVFPSILNLATGQTGMLTHTILPGYASNQNVSWTSSDTTVAIVDSTGQVTPVIPGTATITVTSQDGNFTAQAVVNVILGAGGLVPDEIEFAALKDFYDSLGGPNWTNKTNWPTPGNWPASATSSQFGTWRGITVTNGDVTGIILYTNNLTGVIPESITNLAKLKRLDVRVNKISGTLPSAFTSLTDLEEVRFYENRVTGTIPNDIGSLSKLRVLDFSKNNFTGNIPESIGNLSNLYWLSLYRNEIGGPIPESLYNLTNLTDVHLFSTRISGQLSESIGNLIKLKELWIYGTELTGSLPSSLGNITSLEVLWLHMNNFTGEIPENWRHLTNLKTIVLHWTQLSGVIPDWFSELTKLEILAIGDTYYHGVIPESYGNLTNLSGLYLERLDLEGTIPDELQNLNKLAIVDLKFTDLEGTIPAWLMNKPTLKEFRLNDSKFTGLPDFSARTDKAQLIVNIENNEIPFEDIERYFTSAGTHPFKKFTYAPQRPSITPPKQLHVSLNEQLSIEAPSGGIYGVYLWEKQSGSTWIDITASNESSNPRIFTVNNVDADDNGLYRYRVSNSRVPGLVIQSTPIAVSIVDPLGPEHSRALYNGIISSVTWRTEKAYQTTGSDMDGTYLYDYDDKYQIKEATFGKPFFGATPGYTLQGNQFRLAGMSYDPNGNILTLKRYNEQSLRYNDFTYSYHNSMTTGQNWGDPQTNKLASVSGYAGNYQYNAIGQMIYSETNSNFEQAETFDYGTGFDGSATTSALQDDGRMLIAGSFTNYNGEAAANIVRVNPDGTKDGSFISGSGFNNTVKAIAIQTDGKIIVAGAFTQHNGATAPGIVRLNPNGTVDNSFVTGTGFNGAVTSLAVQTDGKIIITGSFTTYKGATSNRIIRLNPDGSKDGAFAIGSGFNGTTNSAIILPLGSLLISGSFTAFNGWSVNGIVKLSVDGTYDESFRPGSGFAGGTVEKALVELPLLKFIVHGSFTSYNGTPANGIIRLNGWGSVDSTFVYGTGFNGMVRDVRHQPDGKYIVAGSFTSYNGTTVNRIVRLNVDGSVDTTFVNGTGFDQQANALLIRHNNKILVNGDFTSYNGTNANRIISLNDDGSVTPTGNQASSDGTSYKFVQYDVTGKVTDVYEGTAPVASAGSTVPAGYVKKVSYLYDDRGFRLAKVNHETQRTTWYMRDASGNILSVYEQEGVVNEQTPNTNALVQTEIPVYGSGKIGTYYPGQDGSLVYELTDHLGNVRALLRENVNVYTATMEDNEQQEITNPRVEEIQYFENIFETEVTDARMNYTYPIADVVPNPDKSAYLYWVDGMAGMEAADKSIGPAIALKINAGDKVQMETWVRYEEKVSYEGLDLAALASMLGGTFTNVKGFEGYTQTQTTSSLLGAFNAAQYPDGSDITRPNAYLNYIVYDDDMVYQDAGWIRVGEDAGFEPGNEGAPNSRLHKRLRFSSPVEINQNGYIYIWVSNQSEATKVWFDDLKVTHTQHLVVQATDYGVWGDVLREQKADETKYRFGYQGQFAEKDEETGWNHFYFREYDPVIGRWLVADPYGQYWSPYLAMGNNPVNQVDQDGGCSGPNCPNVGDVNDQGQIWTVQGWANPLRDVVVRGTWTESDERNFLGLERIINDFGSWLERNFPIPKGEGIAFYSSDKDSRGPVMHSRDGIVTHSVTDAHAMLITWGKTNKYYGKLPTKYASDLEIYLEALEGVQDAQGAYERLDALPGGVTKAVKEFNEIMHGSVHTGGVQPDSSVVEMAVPGNKNRTIRTATSKENGGVRIDTLDRPIK